MVSLESWIDRACAFSIALSLLLVISTVAVQCFFKFKGKYFLAEFADHYDANPTLIKFINICYKVKSLFIGEKKVCQIKSIIVYPMKSVGKGLKVNSWPIGEFGLKWDRQYMIASYSEKKKAWIPVTLREKPKLINVEYEVEDNDFIVKYAEGKSYKLPMEMSDQRLEAVSSEEKTVSLWGVPVPSYNVSALMPKEFVEEYDLPADSRLVFTRLGHTVTVGAPKNLPNTINGSKYRHATFQDYFPFLFLSTASIDLLNVKLKEYGKEYFQVGEYNFRPNFVVEGEDMKPHSEDSWYRFKLHAGHDSKDHFFTTTTKCGRCMIPNIDYYNGQVMDKSAPVSRILSKYRRVDRGDRHLTFFGVYAVQHETDYTISCGDTIDILQRRVSVYVGS